MRKAILFLVALFICSTAQAAELLVQAKPHWMDGFSQSQIDGLSQEDREARGRRIQRGEIVVVKPDGWVWGKEEKLPNYFVIKLPGVSVETVQKFEEALTADDGVDQEGNPKRKILRSRKFNLPSAYLTLLQLANKSVTTVNSTVILSFIQNMVEKSQ